ncbi:MAG: GxxExxY protein [Acidobacteriota bacterium]
MKVLYKELSDGIVAAAMEVHQHLGHGFLEAVYGKALAYELEIRGVAFEKEVLLPVNYKGKSIGKYKADFVVDQKIILELKAISHLTSAHVAQTQHYLLATGLHLAILFNFGNPSLEHVRV